MTQITIGYLPILDHLILGVAEENSGAYFRQTEIKSLQFSNWKDVSDALLKGDVDGAFLLAPLAM